MSEKIRFNKKDIGAELLSILTTGLYRDTLDTLREYIQNGIDAGATKMSIKITPDTITIDDNGQGMTETIARHAIRLGISDKNPVTSVGFRGIGIYSAFNLCNSAAVYSKAVGDREYRITFDFKKIRHELAKDQERRKASQPSELYLEKVLEDSVYIEKSSEGIISQDSGTKILFSNLLADVYQRLNDWTEVTTYLQDVVPLPFRQDFAHKDVIEQKILSAGEKIIALSLAIGSTKGEVYRPYYNAMFTHGGLYDPKFFDMDDYGFAWISINDSRNVLKDKNLRGLLIKKYGFSIANRTYLEPYFQRVVFNRRITGELIIRHPNLIPNAARSDFEHNSTREAFMRTLPKFIISISRWANEIQEEEKAREVLGEVYDELIELNKTLPQKRRNPDDMLIINVRLSNLKDEILKPHEKRLERIEPARLKEMKALLHECIVFVHSELASSRSRKKNIENLIATSVAREAKEKDVVHKRSEEKFETLTVLLEAFGINIDKDFKEVITYIDDDILKEYLDETQYKEALRQLKDYLGDKF